MKIRKFNKNNTERTYQSDGTEWVCPVCGNYKNLIKSHTEPTKSGMEYDFECPECDFKWYISYIMVQSGAYELNSGDEIEESESIDPRLYNELKLQSKKYNL